MLQATFFAFRVALLIAMLASLILAASFVPEVNTLVPATKAVAAIAKPWLRRAEDWAVARLASLELAPQPQPGAARSSMIPQGRVPAHFEASQAVLISSTPSGATVRVNARTVGKTPLTLKLAPGSYKVTISRPGYATVNRTLTVKQGGPASLGVKLAVEGPSPPQRPSRPDNPAGGSSGQHTQEDGDP